MHAMWSQTLLAGRRRALRYTHRAVLPFRGNSSHGPHTTYFQEPPQKPPRKSSLGRIVIYTGAGFAMGLWTMFKLDDTPQVKQAAKQAKALLYSDMLATQAPEMDTDTIAGVLHTRSTFSTFDKAISHTAQLPSNMPCEDMYNLGSFADAKDPTNPWSFFAIFDGHAGPQTATTLCGLPIVLCQNLIDGKCLPREYTPNDLYIARIIRNTFLEVDQAIVGNAARRFDASAPLAEKVWQTVHASAGSCALVALYDPLQSVLRIANVGDSRAVLGRWDDASRRYVAQALSVDHTGFNPDEVARIEREHPGENVIDPRSGRVHGIAVSRAFGDARWKWSEDLTTKAHDLFWGPSPRPNNVIQTPPYLTAEPEILETQIQKGEHPDFLIMASDGLWDNISNENAVTAVQMWLQKYKPTSTPDWDDPKPSVWSTLLLKLQLRISGLPNIAAGKPIRKLVGDRVGDTDDDTFYDENNRTLRWHVSPKHFTVEDEHCGEHLIKNALGGSRRDLLHGVMSVQPPLSRSVRDDITVHVVFFGDEFGRK